MHELRQILQEEFQLIQQEAAEAFRDLLEANPCLREYDAPTFEKLRSCFITGFAAGGMFEVVRQLQASGGEME